MNADFSHQFTTGLTCWTLWEASSRYCKALLFMWGPPKFWLNSWHDFNEDLMFLMRMPGAASMEDTKMAARDWETMQRQTIIGDEFKHIMEFFGSLLILPLFFSSLFPSWIWWLESASLPASCLMPIWMVRCIHPDGPYMAGQTQSILRIQGQIWARILCLSRN